MSLIQSPENTPVWVNENRCKACDVCVSVCPAGVLAMKQEPTSTLGAMVCIIAKESCIGCCECELSCPDFAIYVADKSEYKFSKLTEEAKQRAEAIKQNNFRVLED